jgi:hypothetical protein
LLVTLTRVSNNESNSRRDDESCRPLTPDLTPDVIEFLRALISPDVTDDEFLQMIDEHDAAGRRGEAPARQRGR